MIYLGKSFNINLWFLQTVESVYPVLSLDTIQINELSAGCWVHLQRPWYYPHSTSISLQFSGSTTSARSPLSVKSGHTWTVCRWSFQNANIFIYSYVFRLQWAHLLDMIQTNFCLIFSVKSKKNYWEGSSDSRREKWRKRQRWWKGGTECYWLIRNRQKKISRKKKGHESLRL